MKVNVINDSVNELPKYAKQGDSGMDLRANFSDGYDEDLAFRCAWDDVSEVLRMFPGGRCAIPIGLYTSFPPGYEIQVRSRSGLAIKYGVKVINSPGTIDSCFRGQWCVLLENSGEDEFEVKQGDRIAQAVLAKVSLIEWNEVENLEASDRGVGGFGHSGVK